MAFELIQPITELQAAAILRIDELAGATRLKYVTISPGQEMSYTAKLADARAYIAAGYPIDATPYSWVKTEATLTDSTPTAVADLIVYTAELWGSVGATIEGRRISAKNKVSASTTSVQVREIEGEFIVAMQSL